MAAGELHAYLDGVRAGTFTQTAQGSLGFEYDEVYRQRRGVMISSAALARLAQPDMAEVITADEGALDARVSCGRSRTSGAGAWRFSR